MWLRQDCTNGRWPAMAAAASIKKLLSAQAYWQRHDRVKNAAETETIRYVTARTTPPPVLMFFHRYSRSSDADGMKELILSSLSSGRHWVGTGHREMNTWPCTQRRTRRPPPSMSSQRPCHSTRHHGTVTHNPVTLFCHIREVLIAEYPPLSPSLSIVFCPYMIKFPLSLTPVLSVL